MDLDALIRQFTTTQRRLLELEREAEISEVRRLRETLSVRELERRGLVILRLRVADEFMGLGGRSMLALAPIGGGELQAGEIGSGDIVTLASSSSDAATGKARDRTVLSGVVHRVGPERLVLVLDDDPESLPAEPLRLDRVTNDVTYRRMFDALEQLERYRGGPAKRLRRVLFGNRPAEFHGRVEPADMAELDPRLDPSQREAVAFALSARDVALVHGPPGTGKTTTLVEVIRLAVRTRERVLACASSNVAVDNLTERLVAAGVRVVRVGHPARLLPSVLEHSLDHLVERSELTRYAAGVRRELDAAHKRLRRAHDFAVRRRLRREVRETARTLREIEDEAVRAVISGAEVVLTTTAGAADPIVGREDFGLVVLDEAAQTLEAAAWIPLLKTRRAVLAGDHCQLPPTILSRRAAEDGLSVTLFERLAASLGSSVMRMLTTQYRMHEAIMTWASRELYAGRLLAHESVRTHRLADLDGVAGTPDTLAPLVRIDTAGCGLEEEEEEEGASRSNPGEAKVVRAHLERLLEAGVKPRDVAIITPYSAQVRLLRRDLHVAHPELEIGTVDGFQGREKEAIIISMVRSNEARQVGFLAEERRMNVAVTRARRHVAIIGDSATVSSHPFLDRLGKYFEEHGDYRSAWEYL